jgi:Transposase DDE domain group 1
MKTLTPKISYREIATVIFAQCLLGKMKENHDVATGTVCNRELFEFPAVKRRQVSAAFTGGEVSSDGGILLLRQADRKRGLSQALAQVLPDPRDPERIVHPLSTFIRQRLYGLCLGYEDLNDHDHLRRDLAWQTAVERDEPLASGPTLCRWENRADRQAGWRMHEVLINQFIASFAQAPAGLMLDFDSTDDRVHGKQEGRFFHGYYGDYCFLPLYVFCGEQLLVSCLRPSNRDSACHAWAVLKLLVQRLRQAWPQVKITVRADSGFCRRRMLRWCEDHGVHCLIGLARNQRLQALAEPLMAQAREQHQQSGGKTKAFGRSLLRGAKLGSGAAGDCQGRTYRPGKQPAFCGDESGGSSAGTV